MAIDQVGFLLVDSKRSPRLTSEGWIADGTLLVSKDETLKILGDYFSVVEERSGSWRGDREGLDCTIGFTDDGRVEEIEVRIALKNRPTRNRLEELSRTIHRIASQLGLGVFSMTEGRTLSTVEEMVDATLHSRAGRLYF